MKNLASTRIVFTGVGRPRWYRRIDWWCPTVVFLVALAAFLTWLLTKAVE